MREQAIRSNVFFPGDKMKQVLIAAGLLLALSQTCGAQASLAHWVVQPPAHGVYIGVYGGPRSNEGSCEGVSRAVGKPVQLCDTYYSIQTLTRIVSDPRYGRVADAGSINVATLGCRSVSYSDIAGGRLDGALQQDAAALKAYASRYPRDPWIMVRLFHEFNMNVNNPRGNPNGNNCFSGGSLSDMQNEFIQAWRHVVTYFASQGVNNVTWVWCPATGPQARRKEGGLDMIQGFYPGSQYVDWTCADTYDKAPQGGGFANAFQNLDFFNQFHKPLMIGETGECNTESRFGRCAGYAHSRSEFISDVERALQPGGPLYNDDVKAWVYFDQRVERSGYDWSFDQNGLNAFKAMLSNPYFYPPIPRPKLEG